MNSPRILQANCQSRTSTSTYQSFVKWSEAEFVNTLKIKYAVNKELAKPPQDKIVYKKIPTLQKNKKRHPQPNTYRLNT